MRAAEIIAEIEQHSDLIISNDQCCIMIDAGIYYPYVDSNKLLFDMRLVEDPKADMFMYADMTRNNRYGKEGFITLSKKYKDGFVSNIGYPIIANKNEIEKYKWLSIVYGFRDANNDLAFFVMTLPLEFNFTEHRNYATMTVRIFADDPADIYGSISTYEYCEENGWKMHRYFIGNPIEADIEDDTEVLVPSSIIQVNNNDDIILYDKQVKLHTMNWRDAIAI